MACAFVNLQPMPKVIDGSLDSWGNSWGIACVAVRFVGCGQKPKSLFTLRNTTQQNAVIIAGQFIKFVAHRIIAAAHVCPPDNVG